MRTLIAALVLAAALAAGEAPAQSPRKPPADAVAVAAFENRSLLREQDWLADAIDDVVTATLVAQGVAVVERQAEAELTGEAELAPLTGDGDGDGRAVGTAAGRVLGGWFTAEGDRVEIELRVAGDNGFTAVSHQAGAIADYAALARAAARAVVPAAAGAAAATAVATPPPATLAPAFYRARRAADRGDHERALADWLRVLREAPQQVEAWRGLGATLEALGRPAAAVAAYERALAADPDASGRTALDLAGASERSGDVDGTIARYRRVMREFPYSRAPEERQYNEGRDPRIADLACDRLRRFALRAGRYDIVRELVPPTDVRYAEHVAGWRWRELRSTAAWPADGGVVAVADASPAIVTAASAPDLVTGVVAPRGKAIASLAVSVSRTDPAGRAPEVVLTFDRPEGASENTNLPEPAQQATTLAGSGPWQATIAVPCTGWGGVVATLRAHGVQDDPRSARWSIQATLRDLRPGCLRIVTRPAGARVTITLANDEHVVVSTPALVRDLPPGPCRLAAETTEDGGGSLAFTGATDAVVAAQGETRVDWPLDAVVKGAAAPPATGWAWRATRVLASPAPRAQQPFESPEDHLACAWSASIGWVAAWDADGDVVIASSRDGDTWTLRTPPPPVNTGARERLLGLVAASDGRVFVVWSRHSDVFASISADLERWSAATVLARPAWEGGWTRLHGLAADAGGRVAAILDGDRTRLAVAAAGRGFGAPAPIVMPATFSESRLIGDRDGFLDLLGAGDGLHVARLGADRRWQPQPPLHPPREAMSMMQPVALPDGGLLFIGYDAAGWRAADGAFAPLIPADPFWREAQASYRDHGAVAVDGGTPQHVLLVARACGCILARIASPSSDGFAALKATVTAEHPDAVAAPAIASPVVAAPATPSTPAPPAQPTPSETAPAAPTTRASDERVEPRRGHPLAWIFAALALAGGGAGGAWWWLRRMKGDA